MNQIMDEYGKDGKVAWVYRHFPIDQLHSKADKKRRRQNARLHKETKCSGNI